MPSIFTTSIHTQFTNAFCYNYALLEFCAQTIDRCSLLILGLRRQYIAIFAWIMLHFWNGLKLADATFRSLTNTSKLCFHYCFGKLVKLFECISKSLSLYVFDICCSNFDFSCFSASFIEIITFIR